MKHYLLLISILIINSYGFTQEYPEYQINVLDQVFKTRLNHITKNSNDTLPDIKIDTVVINLAKSGIYIPTSINLYFSNLDSLLKVNLDSLDEKHRKFITKLKEIGISNVTIKEYFKSDKLFSDISTNKRLRLCFYALYDIEASQAMKELIIIDWKNDGRKYYYPKTDSLLFGKWKSLAVNEVINDCNYGIGTYSFYLIDRNGEAYPKNKAKDEYIKFYLNDWVCWSVLGALHTSLESNQDYKIVYANIFFTCPSTVECPKGKNPFGSEGGWGKDSNEN